MKRVAAAPAIEPVAFASVEPETQPVEKVAEVQEDDEDTLDATGNRLTLASPVVDAPSIGPKTAKRLAPLGIKTIGPDGISIAEAPGASFMF